MGAKSLANQRCEPGLTGAASLASQPIIFHDHFLSSRMLNQTLKLTKEQKKHLITQVLGPMGVVSEYEKCAKLWEVLKVS